MSITNLFYKRAQTDRLREIVAEFAPQINHSYDEELAKILADRVAEEGLREAPVISALARGRFGGIALSYVRALVGLGSFPTREFQSDTNTVINILVGEVWSEGTEKSPFSHGDFTPGFIIHKDPMERFSALLITELSDVFDFDRNFYFEDARMHPPLFSFSWRIENFTGKYERQEFAARDRMYDDMPGPDDPHWDTPEGDVQ